MGKDCGADLFEGEYQLAVDSMLKVRDFTFYGVTPTAWPLSFVYIFDKNDSLVDIVNHQGFLSQHFPFQFKTYDTDDKTFLAIFFVGGGNVQTNLGVEIFSISDSVRSEYGRSVYSRDKQDDELLNRVSAFYFEQKHNELMVIKVTNDSSTAKEILPWVTVWDSGRSYVQKRDTVILK
ncbi:MAG: hypothetical protein AB8F95_00945 [Bacteroidia bacterium]